jgi:hypothetical protein
VLFIHSAGNDGGRVGEGALGPSDTLTAHARPNLIHVAALDEQGVLLPKSNRGAPHVTLAAPARHMSAIRMEPSLEPSDHYYYTGQTSQATPWVANLAAKMRLLAPGLSPAEIRQILVRTSTPREALRADIEAGGAVAHDLALDVAALTELIRSGMTPQAALDALALPETVLAYLEP